VVAKSRTTPVDPERPFRKMRRMKWISNPEMKIKRTEKMRG
jgi:hypothetical protein